MFSLLKFAGRLRLLPALTCRSMAVFKYKWDDEKYEMESYEKSRESHLTNAEELISKTPPIEVDGDVAMCSVNHRMGARL